MTVGDETLCEVTLVNMSRNFGQEACVLLVYSFKCCVKMFPFPNKRKISSENISLTVVADQDVDEVI